MPPTNPKSGTDWLRRQTKRIGDGEELPVSAADAYQVEVESWLQSRGVQYAPPSAIPMSLIDVKRSRQNQARKDPIVPDSVDRFSAALRNGAKFPPIVVYPLGGKLIIIDGNNRHASHLRVGADTIYGIVISEETPSELIQLLTVEANASHGVTPELSWRQHQAFHLVSLGFDDQSAAEAAGLGVQQLRLARAIQAADQRARVLKINGFGSLAQMTRQALGTLRDEAVFCKAAKLAVDTAMTIDEVRDLTRVVKTLPSETARVEYIARVAKERGITRAARKAAGKVIPQRVSSPRHRLMTGIGKVIAVDETDLVRSVVTVADRDELITRLRELREKLTRMELAVGTLRGLDQGA